MFAVLGTSIHLCFINSLAYLVKLVDRVCMLCLPVFDWCMNGHHRYLSMNSTVQVYLNFNYGYGLTGKRFLLEGENVVSEACDLV